MNPTEAEIEAAAYAISKAYDPDYTWESLARAALIAAAPIIRAQALAEAKARVQERVGAATMASPEFRDGFNSGLEEALAAIDEGRIDWHVGLQAALTAIDGSEK